MAASAALMLWGFAPSDQLSAQAAGIDLARPGAEHAALAQLVGEWRATTTSMSGARVTVPASARMILGGRFLDVEIGGADSLFGTAARLMIGFDRRHNVYQVSLFDTWGTYFVTARGSADSPRVMTGTDDDPVMRDMGLTKEFVVTLRVLRPDQVAIDIGFVDTRSPARHIVPAGGYSLERGS